MVVQCVKMLCRTYWVLYMLVIKFTKSLNLSNICVNKYKHITYMHASSHKHTHAHTVKKEGNKNDEAMKQWNSHMKCFNFFHPLFAFWIDIVISMSMYVWCTYTFFFLCTSFHIHIFIHQQYTLDALYSTLFQYEVYLSWIYRSYSKKKKTLVHNSHCACKRACIWVFSFLMKICSVSKYGVASVFVHVIILFSALFILLEIFQFPKCKWINELTFVSHLLEV